MSTTARDEPAARVESGRRLSSLVTKMKSALKRSGTKRLSFLPKPEAAPATTTAPSTAKATEPTVATAEDTPKAEAPKIPVPAPEGYQPMKVNRAEIDAERARKLGERFKISIEPAQWASEREAYRIEKPIRMRIHRQCHRCMAALGSNRECSQCHHVRCTRCPRYPPKQTAGRAQAPSKEAPFIEPDYYYNYTDVIELRKPNPRPGGQPLVRKRPLQRIRRTCHECKTMFAPNTKICANCQHIRCADCPRDPAKKKKYPDGYPGDAPSSDVTKPVKYACHQCAKIFPPIPHPDSGEEQPRLECIRCGHERCQQCQRAPPRRIEPEPDPEIVKRVEEKLAALNLSSASAGGS